MNRRVYLEELQGPSSFRRKLNFPGLRFLKTACVLIVAFPLSAAAVPEGETNPALLDGYMCDKGERGRRLNLAGAWTTFVDEFDHPSVTGPDGNGPWFAPIHGGFGAAQFLPPSPGEGPFFFQDGILTIRMAKRGDRWYSGIMQTVNATGKGFTQRYGYFEIKAKFPKGQGTWPAFWLKTVNQFVDPTKTRAEIDIIEAYGGNDWNGHHAAVHLWPARDRSPEQLQKHWWKSCYTRIDGDMFDGQWHVYGGEVTPDWVIIYFEGQELARFKTLPEFKHPLFILVDLALNPQEPRDSEQPAEMLVDYVRVWQRPEWASIE